MLAQSAPHIPLYPRLNIPSCSYIAPSTSVFLPVRCTTRMQPTYCPSLKSAVNCIAARKISVSQFYVSQQNKTKHKKEHTLRHSDVPIGLAGAVSIMYTSNKLYSHSLTLNLSKRSHSVRSSGHTLDHRWNESAHHHCIRFP